MANRSRELTKILNSFSENSESINEALPLVYDELRVLAQRELRHERKGHTLNTTALVHEAYMKLINHPPKGEWDGRHHFFGIAARAMRQILVNYAKKKNRKKRGGKQTPAEFDEGIYLSTEKAEEIVALDEALGRLEKINERQARVIECRYFAGYNIEETADILEISPATVKRDWTVAKAWLYNQIYPAE
ncbi:MAG: ECF-type sigma factor [Balneolaceae bacterium]|nr:ECF-type sigma factor [Balneolaceae bacterium]